MLRPSSYQSRLRQARYSALAAIATLAGAAALHGCGEDGTVSLDNTPRVACVAVTPDTATVFSVGATAEFQAAALTRGGSEIAGTVFEWSSSDPAVATVTASGVVTGVGAGVAVISASTGAVSGSATLLVDPNLVLRNYCTSCHRGFHIEKFETVSCPACHSVTPDPRKDENHHQAANGHQSASGGFNLRGAHGQLSCRTCHDLETADPTYDPADENDCITCHADDYQSQHGGSGFPTTCLTCHNTNSFSGASFDHDARFFPIFSGNHKAEWSGCETCHTDPGDFAVFTCFNCHKHNKDDMDKEHEDISGYAYQSSRCLACHPRGKD